MPSSPRHPLALLFCLVFAGCTRPASTLPPPSEPSPVYGDAFWSAWGDGRAELCAYDLVTPRYGAPRRGTAVSILVTETFSNEARVKADPGRHGRTDEFPVLKLNLVQDFATGVYDYNLMTSSFTALAPMNARPAGAPTKVSFSAQEWCGHAYTQLLFDERYGRYSQHSYFDGEADADSSLLLPGHATSEDALLVWARGFATPVVAAGDSTSRPIARSLRTSRLLHQPVIVETAVYSRGSVPETVTVPAGTFATDIATVRVEGGRTWRFWVERGGAGRVVRWSCSDGEQAELLGAERLAYWQQNAPGGEQALARLGLAPRPPRMP